MPLAASAESACSGAGPVLCSPHSKAGFSWASLYIHIVLYHIMLYYDILLTILHCLTLDCIIFRNYEYTTTCQCLLE